MIEYPSIINLTQTLTKSIASKYVNQEFQLFISLPASYQNTDQSYPVFYVLDGNGCFGIARMVIEMQQVMGGCPDIIIVGIGYPTATYLDTVTLRGRDFTIKELTEKQKSEDSYPFGETGGAANFYSFLSQELLPMIDSEFRTNPLHRTLTGFSMSATFVLYAMFQLPHQFQHIISISPDAEEVAELEAQYAENHSSLPVSLDIALEHTNDRWLDQVKSFVEHTKNRNYPDYKVNLRVFEETDHVQAALVGFTYMIKDIYAT